MLFFALALKVFVFYIFGMNICLFDADEIGKPLSVRDERGEHIVKILHKKEGESFTAGIIDGVAGKATITKIADGFIHFDFAGEKPAKPLYPLKMIIGFPRPIQLKRLLRDVAALGACEVHLTGTELGEKSYRQSSLVEKGSAYKMLLDGIVQAGGTFVPKLFIHDTLKECVESLCGEKPGSSEENGVPEESAKTEECAISAKSAKTEESAEIRIALDNIDPAATLVAALAKGKQNGVNAAVAAIGSERGWTDKERKYLESQGFLRCGMGPRIMRTETAATVAASVISASFGWLD